MLFTSRYRTITLIAFALACSLAHAESGNSHNEPSISVKNIPADARNDTAITIGNGPNAGFPNYQVITSSEEIAGDPDFYKNNAYASWKQACASFKKETKELNADRLISINCGIPKSVQTGEVGTRYTTYVSTGTFKTVVKVKEPK
jgi:hypothetical protein